MEIYVAAIISYRLKPHKRVWSPDGIESLIEITVPKAVDEHLTKDLSQMETEKRLSYLADIADTKGWSIRHTTEPTPNSSMVSDQYYAAQQTVGMLDEDGSVARKFDAMISRADQERHDRIIQNMYYQAQTQAPTPQPTTNQAPNDNVGDTTVQNDEHLPKFNPYPTIHQSVIQPTSQQSNTTANSPIQASSTEPTKPAEPTANTSATAASDDIISLANNSGLSIAALQHEVDRVKQKKEDSEVFISLR